jgi:CBS-domain-containing membrane protein
VAFPVVDETGKLIGIVSEGDFIRRGEIRTQRKRGRWLTILAGPGRSASDFLHEQGRKVEEIMTSDLDTATEDMPLEDVMQLMERQNVKRLPVVRGDVLVGIVTRSDLLRAVASLARDVPDPTADDDHIRERVIASIETKEWCPLHLGVTIRDGIVHLSGFITDERFRQATIVAAESVSGVRLVHDHLYLFDAMSGFPSGHQKMRDRQRLFSALSREAGSDDEQSVLDLTLQRLAPVVQPPPLRWSMPENR